MRFETIISDDAFFNTHIRGTTGILGRIFGDEEFANIPPAVLEEAMRRGSAVHKAIEEFSTTGARLTMRVEDLPYFESFMQWYNKYNPEFVGAELKLLSERLGFKGVIDALFIVDNTLVMCDYKTSSKLNMTKVTLQLNMYLALLEDSGLLDGFCLQITDLRVLQITKTKFKYVKVDIDKDLHRAVMKLYNLKVQHNE